MIIFGSVFALLGLPLLSGQDSPLAIISCIGALFDCIFIIMAGLTMVEGKYEKRA